MLRKSFYTSHVNKLKLPIFTRENGKYTAKEMGALWKQHIETHRNYLQSIDDLLPDQGIDKIVLEEKTESENSNNKKSSWFGLWAK